MEELIQGIPPEIIEKELIQDGTGNNYRTVKQRYITTDMVIDEVFTYKHSANHPAWASVQSRQLVEADLSEVKVFRSWSISNHPIQTSITRSVDLVKLQIDKDKVLSVFIIKHDGQIEDRLATFIGDNTNQIEYEGALYGERDLWDMLTENGATPYQLLDQRVPVMDSIGRFNEIYNG